MLHALGRREVADEVRRRATCAPSTPPCDYVERRAVAVRRPTAGALVPGAGRGGGRRGLRPPGEPRPRPPSAQPRGDGQPRAWPRGHVLRARWPGRLRPRPGRRRAVPRPTPPRAHHAAGRGVGAAATRTRRHGRDRPRGPRGLSRSVPRPSPSTSSARGLGGPGPRHRRPRHTSGNATRIVRPTTCARCGRPGPARVGLGPDALEAVLDRVPRRPGPGPDPAHVEVVAERTAAARARPPPGATSCGRGAASLGQGAPATAVEEAADRLLEADADDRAHVERVERRGVGERRYVVGARERHPPPRASSSVLLAARGMDTALGPESGSRPDAGRGPRLRPRLIRVVATGGARRRRSPVGRPGRPGG